MTEENKVLSTSIETGLPAPGRNTHLVSCMAALLVACTLWLPCQCRADATTALRSTETSTVKTIPIDWRTRIAAEAFTKTREGEWESPVVEAAFPFDELVYSWNVRLPRDEGFRIRLKVAFAPGDETSWLYGGYWGQVTDPVTSRSKPNFERGEVDLDWLKLKAKATSYCFRITSASTKTLSVLPSLVVLTTDNHPSAELVARNARPTASSTTATILYDVPFRRQMDSKGTVTPNRCQSAALASAMQYFGKTVKLEDIIALIHDPEYDYPGLWPRIIGAACEFGFDGYIDRFRDWDSVRTALAEHKIILCSIRMEQGECKAPPYDEMGNHIVALNGVTDDGRVVVTDSFLAKSGRGHRCQWLMEDFEKVWMDTKNGIAMVICPPAGAKPRPLRNLPAFPADRKPITGDDH